MAMIDPRGRVAPAGRRRARWCALCGAEYVAGVAECVDCLVALVEQPPLRPTTSATRTASRSPTSTTTSTPRSGSPIDRVLADAGIVHAWEGTTLVVAPYDEDEVDRLLDGAADEVETRRHRRRPARRGRRAGRLRPGRLGRRPPRRPRRAARGRGHRPRLRRERRPRRAGRRRGAGRRDRRRHRVPRPARAGRATSPTGSTPSRPSATSSSPPTGWSTTRLDTEGVLAAVDASRAIEAMSVPFGFCAAGLGGARRPGRRAAPAARGRDRARRRRRRHRDGDAASGPPCAPSSDQRSRRWNSEGSPSRRASAWARLRTPSAL